MSDSVIPYQATIQLIIKFIALYCWDWYAYDNDKNCNSVVELYLLSNIYPDIVAASFDYYVAGDSTLEENGPLPVNSTFTIKTSISNNGQQPVSDFNLDFFLSKNSSIDPSEDLLIGSYNIASEIAPGGVLSIYPYPVLHLPELSIDYYSTVYIGMVLDIGNVVQESNEENNRNQGIGVDSRAVQLYDPIASWEQISLIFQNQRIATRYLIDNHFDDPVPRQLDAGWSKNVSDSVFSRYNGQVMPEGAFRIQAFIENAEGHGSYRIIRFQGADAEFNPLGISNPFGEPNPRWAETAVITEPLTYMDWLNYVIDYHRRF